MRTKDFSNGKPLILVYGYVVSMQKITTLEYNSTRSRKYFDDLKVVLGSPKCPLSIWFQNFYVRWKKIFVDFSHFSRFFHEFVTFGDKNGWFGCAITRSINLCRGIQFGFVQDKKSTKNWDFSIFLWKNAKIHVFRFPYLQFFIIFYKR